MALSAGKGKKVKKPPSPRDLLKLELAGEMGLLDKVEQSGWAELTAAESGRLGALMSRRIREGALANPRKG